MTEKLYRLIILWQGEALTYQQGPRTKENLAKARVLTSCAQELLDTLAEDVVVKRPGHIWDTNVDAFVPDVAEPV